ncbi:MAG: M23 family metallopeptidase [Cyclobacteriaceae bacterium]|jgi:murein DD-endopeptidase MepM/ murein hydrolase activator NlpD|nr:M23 family metallopeptidase [Cyclobacteriaceae bacterium]
MLGFVIAVPGVDWYIKKYHSLQEQQLLLENHRLTRQWNKTQQQLQLLSTQLDSLNWKDDHHYRALLDLPPLPAEMREAGVGGSKRADEGNENIPLISGSFELLNKLNHKLTVALQSFEQIEEATHKKNQMLATRPAIQPINNRDLTTLHLTFGTRLHPIFNSYMDHKGLDLSARFGTPVYSTADGRVSMAYHSGSYGNVVFIDHGFGFETRYAHLQKFAVKAGNFVKRGEVIGYVGNTGISVAPHLHYEVYFQDKAVNPIHFFQRDLKPSEYQKIIQSPISKP